MTAGIVDPPPYGDDYIEGWKAGYAKGCTDGEARGYSDGRYRAWLAIQALEATNDFPASTIRRLEEAITNIVGKLA